MALIAGIDPGLHGGLAVLTHEGACLLACPLPADEGGLDAAALAALLRRLPARPARAAVELVGAMPGQGVVSMFRFGDTVGRILGVLATLGVQTLRPTPRAWQKALGVALPPGSEGDKAERRAATKARALAYVEKHWPGVQLVQPRCRTPHDGVVDALCLAEWLRGGSGFLA